MFQIALAAYEIGELDSLYCSIVDRPGKWGSILARVSRGMMFQPLGAESLPGDKMLELPIPILLRKLPELLKIGPGDNYLSSNKRFSRDVAKRLRLGRHRNCRLFVGSESCSLECFLAAKELGLACVLECPGIPDDILDQNVSKACDEFRLRSPRRELDQAMAIRKKHELELADYIIVCSDLHKDHLEKNGMDAKLCVSNPLWVDQCFLDHQPIFKKRENSPLRLLYCGPISIAKGAPYLLKAAEQLEDCHITVCGTEDFDLSSLRLQHLDRINFTPRVPRTSLVALFAQHDVLIMPSLGDSFGFVALEAMASGLPVIVTDAVGVPVPDPTWRVPSNDYSSIVSCVREYLDTQSKLETDSVLAAKFAREFTPERYRARTASLLMDFLGAMN